MEKTGAKNHDMEFSIDNKIIGLPVRQNQQEFVVGVFKIGQILTFTKYTSRLIRDYDENGFPIYNDEIQRQVENSRVEKIADFLINDPEATFPTNLVLHIPQEVIVQQQKHNNFIEIFIDEKVYSEVKKEILHTSSGDIYISIIDGQHRIRGIEIAIERLNRDIKTMRSTLSGASKNHELSRRLDYLYKRLKDLLNIELVVSFFIAKQLEYQAMIFSTINRTQKRVSESLVYSLFGLSTEDSPQKTALQVVLALNAHSNSPFYNRIKLYGGDYERNQTPPLSQATMVKSIINLISENARQAENDRFRSRKELLRRSAGSNKELPFRKYYATNKDNAISNILFYYFSAVKSSFEVEGESMWDFNPEIMKPSNILHTTVGYQALLEILIDILPKIDEDKRFQTSTYKPYTDKFSELRISDATRYPFTSKSKNIFYLDMSLLLEPAKAPNDPRVLKLHELLKKD
ncbi:MAG: DGQHR domain-containing protein [Agriterribacter sp.]